MELKQSPQNFGENMDAVKTSHRWSGCKIRYRYRYRCRYRSDTGVAYSGLEWEQSYRRPMLIIFYVSGVNFSMTAAAKQQKIMKRKETNTQTHSTQQTKQNNEQRTTKVTTARGNGKGPPVKK
jgi:hypothetical protein